ncbi:tetratricopeptide repeat protein [Streptomyces sp. NK08204]|uniref:tetratricopeptide repeat protein n=1 Tax=Streptomyces sp. NK08204 TaxID=2873260 RepID=UPI0035A96927
MGGIGKTALALEAAHRACGKGWFPGGTLFVDLRGYDENPVTADQAVLALLDVLGVQGPELPTTTARQHDAYRDALVGRARTLIVLDNVSDPAQFRELLPGTDRHRVLITSRDRQDALPIRLIDLETLDPADSVALLTRALLDADERDDRPGREPEALHRLAELCGHLPLALQIAAAMLRRRRIRGIASLVAEIEQAGDPSRVLDSGSPGADLYGRSLALRPVLETSYRRLPDEQARLLRLLALVPGGDVSTEAVAALGGLDLLDAVRVLEDLAATYLVTPVVGDGLSSEHRWRMHDLVRAFTARVGAGDAALREEREAARDRLFGFYLRWADAADTRLRWLPGTPEPERFADPGQALAWLDGERAALVAAVQWASEEGHADVAMALGQCLTTYLDWRRYFDDLVSVTRAAQEAAHQLGDSRYDEATTWGNLGNALSRAGRLDEAVDALTHALDLFQATGDRTDEAMAWVNLGITRARARRLDDAIDALTRARDLFQATGDHIAEARTWLNIGNVLGEGHRMNEAIDALTHALDLFQATGDRHSEGVAWHNLGLALQGSDRIDQSNEAFGHAGEIHQEFGDWYRVGQALSQLAHNHEGLSHPATARAHWLKAADAYSRANAPAEAAVALSRADSLT